VISRSHRRLLLLRLVPRSLIGSPPPPLSVSTVLWVPAAPRTCAAPSASPLPLRRRRDQVSIPLRSHDYLPPCGSMSVWNAGLLSCSLRLQSGDLQSLLCFASLCLFLCFAAAFAWALGLRLCTGFSLDRVAMSSLCLLLLISIGSATGSGGGCLLHPAAPPAPPHLDWVGGSQHSGRRSLDRDSSIV
jgi:hypothetical protein